MQESDSAETKFIVGLGNPGRQYERTRHNVGFVVVDALAQRWQAGCGKKAFGGLVYDARFGGGGTVRRVVMLEPHTFMNCSGAAVASMMSFFKAAWSDLLVVMDDLALPPGQLRFRAAGSSGGHKGLADVLSALGSEDVPRLRIGIGSPPPPMETVDFVLTTFGRAEAETMERAVATAQEAVECWLVKGMAAAMDTYNRKAED
ncbi:MAG: aminoacyl-tRNA hydrolase [Phycisphaerae bacterium]